MTALAAGRAYVLRNSSLTIDATDYANAATAAALTPDTSVQTVKTLVPDGVYQDIDNTTWTFDLSGIQDWAAGGLAKYMNDHVGELVDVVWTPKIGGPSATFSMTALPLPFGGDQGSFNTFDKVSFPVSGQPVFSDTSS